MIDFHEHVLKSYRHQCSFVHPLTSKTWAAFIFKRCPDLALAYCGELGALQLILPSTTQAPDLIEHEKALLGQMALSQSEYITTFEVVE